MATSDVEYHTELHRPWAAVTTTLVGEVDASSADQVLEHVGSLSEPPDLVDCRFLGFADAAAVRVLLALARDHGVAVIPSTPVERLLRVCGLGHLCRARSLVGPPALDEASFGIALFDGDLRFAYVNEAMAAANGLPADAHLGHRPDEILDVVEGDLVPAIRAAAAGIRFDRMIDATVNGQDLVVRCTIDRIPYGDNVGAMALVRRCDLEEGLSTLGVRRLRFDATTD